MFLRLQTPLGLASKQVRKQPSAPSLSPTAAQHHNGVCLQGQWRRWPVSMQQQRPSKVPRRDISSTATEQVGQPACMPPIQSACKRRTHLAAPLHFFCRGDSKATWHSKS